jgi:hypothetical protein
MASYLEPQGIDPPESTDQPIACCTARPHRGNIARPAPNATPVAPVRPTHALLPNRSAEQLGGRTWTAGPSNNTTTAPPEKRTSCRSFAKLLRTPLEYFPPPAPMALASFRLAVVPQFAELVFGGFPLGGHRRGMPARSGGSCSTGGGGAFIAQTELLSYNRVTFSYTRAMTAVAVEQPGDLRVHTW